MEPESAEAFKPNYATPPGETLRETLEHIGMTQAELAERTGRPKKTVNEIIVGKASLTADTAIHLERVLGIPASFWNSLEKNYQEYLARKREGDELAKDSKWLKKFPLPQIFKNDWIVKELNQATQLGAVLNYFGVAGVDEWEKVWGEAKRSYRHSPAYERNPASVAVWLRKGEIEAQQVECSPFSMDAFKNSLSEILKLTVESDPKVFHPKLVELCSRAGVAVVFVPELKGTCTFGATHWLTGQKALIQLSLRGKTDDHMWFTYFHEAAHILFDKKSDRFVDSEKHNELNENEVRANEYAQNILIPPGKYARFIQAGRYDSLAIINFAREIGIAAGIVVGRLQFDKKIPPNSPCNRLKKHFQFQVEKI